MNLILHIGEAKTGSTSIQNALFQNKDLLDQSGILCPMDSPSDHFYIWFLLGGPPNVSARKCRKLKKIALNNLKNIRKNVESNVIHTVVLSSEPFFDLSQKQLKKLLNLIDIHFDRIQVIVYIRNPADLYFSHTQELLKTNCLYNPPCEWERNLFPQLLLWEKMVGKENILIRPYAKSLFPKGNVVRDFFHHLETLSGSDLSKIVYAESEYNTSLSAEQIIAFQRYRRNFLMRSNGLITLRSVILLKFFEYMNSKNANPSTKAELRPELRNLICRNNIRFYEDIDSHFSTALSQSLFNPPPAAFPESWNGTFADVSAIMVSWDENVLSDVLHRIPEYCGFHRLSFRRFIVGSRYYLTVFSGVFRTRLRRTIHTLRFW